LPHLAGHYTFGHMRRQQKSFFKNQKLYSGGTLRKKRAGRGARPISARESMHLILKSTRAQGDWSFRAPKNRQRVLLLLHKFAARNAVKIISVANAGNHLHIHLRLTSRHLYRAFIRGVTSAIAMAITGASRWKKMEGKFWDYRPFSRVVRGWKAFLALKDYLHVNQLENAGANRREARVLVAWRVTNGTFSAFEGTG